MLPTTLPEGVQHVVVPTSQQPGNEENANDDLHGADTNSPFLLYGTWFKVQRSETSYIHSLEIFYP